MCAIKLPISFTQIRAAGQKLVNIYWTILVYGVQDFKDIQSVLLDYMYGDYNMVIMWLGTVQRTYLDGMFSNGVCSTPTEFKMLSSRYVWPVVLFKILIPYTKV
jgi:hypothetical protein